VGELASSAFSSRWSDEHVAIERIERSTCGMEPETALAFVTNDDPGGLVVCIDRISFGHGYPLRRLCRRPLLCDVLGDWARERSATTTAAAGRHGPAVAESGIDLRIETCHGGTSIEAGVHEDTSWHLSV
jgi:hypothetical protein